MTTPDTTTAPAGQPLRRILLVVTGLSEQVVTETVFALAQENDGEGLPHDVHIVTTSTGAERVRLNLLSDSPGWFQKLRTDYKLPPIRLADDTLHLIRNARDEALTDIRTPADNVAAADTITRVIRTLTRDPDTALHVSIAGGRKSMGFFAGYALSMFGRSQDRLTHVLVSDKFESNRSFYYPTPYTNVIYATRGDDSEPLDTAKAEVTLADLPFIPLRHGLPSDMLEGESSYSDAVSAATLTLGTPSLVLDRSTGRVSASGYVIQLPPAEFAFYAWLVSRHINGQPPVSAPPEGAPDEEHGDEYLYEYASLTRAGHAGVHEGNFERVRDSLETAGGMTKRYFEQRKTRLHEKLRQTLKHNAKTFELQTVRRTSPTTYVLQGLLPSQIQFANIETNRRRV